MGQKESVQRIIGEPRPLERSSFPRNKDVRYEKLEVTDPKLVEWANANYTVQSYPGGEYQNNGSSYVYTAGKTLRIKDEPVMDTCEGPWCQDTIRNLFEGIKGARRDLRSEYEAPRILELGYGLGVTSLELLRGLDSGVVNPGPRGGEYTVVELNEKIARFAEKTVGDRIKRLRALDTDQEGKIQATVVQGDAYDALEKMVGQIKTGARKPFDGIVSDLYDPEQSDGTTDLKRMDLMREALADNGFFTFFVYHNKSSASGVNRVQESLLEDHGFAFRMSTANVNPNPNYEYLFHETSAGLKPVRRLTTITAWKESGATASNSAAK